jgi:hypothetical protein
MDIKQLVTGDPKTGFYPITQDTITVIELNKAVMSLTNESSSEDIIAAFDNLESFQALIAEVRNPQNICSGILVNETPEDKRVGKYEASIIANTDTETLHVRWIEIDKIVALTITNTDGTMSCIRNENNVGGGSENIYIINGNKINDNTFNIDDFNKLKTAIRNNNIVFINITEDPSYINIIGTQILSYGENLIQLYVIDYSKADGETPIEYIIYNIAIEDSAIKITQIQSNLENKFLTKDNTTPFTPDADYEPATKKYVDENNFVIVDSIFTTSPTPTIDISIFNNNTAINPYDPAANRTLINKITNAIKEGKIIITSLNEIPVIPTKQTYISDSYDTSLSGYGSGFYLEFDFRDNYRIELTVTYSVSTGPEAKASVKVVYVPYQRVLTESEYSALGEAVNTDGILYFVTPDA